MVLRPTPHRVDSIAVGYRAVEMARPARRLGPEMIAVGYHRRVGLMSHARREDDAL
jgi:hypothetical protein